MMPNIKIQRAGPDVPGHRFEFLPAADLGVRWARAMIR